MKIGCCEVWLIPMTNGSECPIWSWWAIFMWGWPRVWWHCCAGVPLFGEISQVISSWSQSRATLQCRNTTQSGQCSLGDNIPLNSGHHFTCGWNFFKFLWHFFLWKFSTALMSILWQSITDPSHVSNDKMVQQWEKIRWKVRIGSYRTLSRARLHFEPCFWSIFLNRVSWFWKLRFKFRFSQYSFNIFF